MAPTELGICFWYNFVYPSLLIFTLLDKHSESEYILNRKGICLSKTLNLIVPVSYLTAWVSLINTHLSLWLFNIYLVVKFWKHDIQKCFLSLCFILEYINLLKFLIKAECDFSSLLINNTFNTFSLYFLIHIMEKLYFDIQKRLINIKSFFNLFIISNFHRKINTSII